MLYFNSCRHWKFKTKTWIPIPTGSPITVVNDAIEILPLVADKTINDLWKYSKKAIYLLNLLLINPLSLISAVK